MAEQKAVNFKVRGSSPRGGAKIFETKSKQRKDIVFNNILDIC